MRPVDRVLEELTEAALTAVAAARGGPPATEADALAAEAVARDYAALPPDEQEAVRVHLGVREGATPDDVALAALAGSPRRAEA